MVKEFIMFKCSHAINEVDRIASRPDPDSVISEDYRNRQDHSPCHAHRS